MSAHTGPRLPDFTTILNEIPALIGHLSQAAGHYHQAGDSKRTFSIDMLEIARDHMRDLQGLSGPEVPPPPADAFSRN